MASEVERAAEMTRGDRHLRVSASRPPLFSPIAFARTGIFATILLAFGCGSGKADVAGKVTYNGKPLATGTVSMVGPDGIIRQGAINADGTYQVTGVAAGKVQIGVLSPRPVGAVRSNRQGGKGTRLAPPTDGGPDTSTWFAIPG